MGGMPVGRNAHKVPPPWVISMQRYGPPPSYPNLKIPGLNAAIPEGCSFGYHAGGWGKPPVDETGKPLYGEKWNLNQKKKKVKRKKRRRRKRKKLQIQVECKLQSLMLDWLRHLVCPQLVHL